MRSIRFTQGAAKSLSRLPVETRLQIGAKPRRYAETGAGDVKALAGRPGLRLWVSEFRVVFIQSGDAIEVLAIGNRRDIYRVRSVRHGTSVHQN